MSDLIDRQAAIDALADYIHNVDKVMGTGHLTADDCKDAAASVFEELPSAQPEVLAYGSGELITELQWIPCNERMPSEGENILLCDTRFGNVAIGRLIKYNTSCCWEVDHWDCDIEDWQAWMPLPEPWEGEQP